MSKNILRGDRMERTRDFIIFLVRYYNITKIKVSEDEMRYKGEQCIIDVSGDDKDIFKTLYIWSCVDDELYGDDILKTNGSGSLWLNIEEYRKKPSHEKSSKEIECLLKHVRNKNIRDNLFDHCYSDSRDDDCKKILKDIKMPSISHFLYNNCNSRENHTIRMSRKKSNSIQIGFSARCKKKDTKSEEFVNLVLEIIKSRYKNMPIDIDDNLTNKLKCLMSHSIDEDDLNDSYLYLGMDDCEMNDDK